MLNYFSEVFIEMEGSPPERDITHYIKLRKEAILVIAKCQMMTIYHNYFVSSLKCF